MNFVPDAAQLAQAKSQATAPAFVLGAVAAFIAVLLNRLTIVVDRVRSLNEIADSDTARVHLKSDILRLRMRAKLLNSATFLALLSALCTSLLLVLGFASGFLGLRHEYGAAILFAVGLLGGSLFNNDVLDHLQAVRRRIDHDDAGRLRADASVLRPCLLPFQIERSISEIGK